MVMNIDQFSQTSKELNLLACQDTKVQGEGPACWGATAGYASAILEVRKSIVSAFSIIAELILRGSSNSRFPNSNQNHLICMQTR